MEDASPIALDFSYQFDDNPHGNGSNASTSRNIAGCSISHSQPKHISPKDVYDIQHSRATTHPYSASMASIGSVVEHGAQRTISDDGLPPSAKNIGPDENDPDTPAWSEMKTKAGKERKRLPLACIACRRKKIKCSGEKPVCKHCLKARIPCVYKVNTRKAAPRTDYMAMLDKRLKRMEDRVIRIIPKEDSLDTSQRSSVRPPLPGTVPKSDEQNGPNAKRTVEEAFTHELNDWSTNRRGGMRLGHTARIRSQRDSDNKLFTEGAEALPSQMIQEHLAEVFFDCVYGQTYLLLHKPSFMRKLKAGLVPPILILCVCAVSARFSTHPQVSTEPAFLRGGQWATPARVVIEKRHAEPNITILTCMVILGFHYFGTCEGGLSWSFGGQAMRMGYALHLHKELDRDPLGLAQAERAAATGKPVPSISELSFTDREIRRRTMWSCYLMDTFNSSGTERPAFLNEDYFSIQLPVKESKFQSEIPGHTEDIEGHVPLSSKNALSDPSAEAKANMGIAAYLIRAVVIWKRTVKYLNLGGKEKDPHPIWDPLSQFANLQRQIAQFRNSLPSSLVYNQENLQAHVTERLANQFIFMHIVAAQNSLFLHRFAIPTAPNKHRSYPPNTPKSFLATAATTVLDAASQISKLIADSTGHNLTAPFAGYCTYASATVHVWGIFSKNVMLENTSRENLRHNYKYLNRMKRYWGMFHYMAESIKDIYRAFADASARADRKQQAKVYRTPDGQMDLISSGVASAEQHSRADSPSAANDMADDSGQVKSDDQKVEVFQYGDWFNRYPHGVSEQEWEQSHLPHRGESQKNTEAVMSQQAELQSVEEFFASLSPPSKAEDGPNKKKIAARKRGKSMVEEKTPARQKEATTEEQTRKQTSRTQSHAASEMPQPLPDLASNSLYPLSCRTFPPNFDISTPDLDVPMSGISAGLKSGQGNSAFDLSSPTAISSTYIFPPVTGPMSNLKQGTQQQQQQTSSQPPFDYVSPTSSSNTGTNNAANSQMNFNFNYTSAVPQLDRQMVYSGYSGIDPSASGATNALNNIEFWNNPWDSAVDIDGFSGFDDPSLGLYTDTGVTGKRSSHIIDEDGEQRRRSNTQIQQRDINSNDNNSQDHILSSTAWFMPFNIEPPNATTLGSEEVPGGFDGFDGFDALMDMGGGFPFSPGLGEQKEDTRGGGM